MGLKLAMPRILMVTARADIGGGPRHVFDLASALREDVELFISSPIEKPYSDLFRSISVGFFEIPKRRFSLFVAFKLLAFTRRHRIQIVHSHGRGAGSYSRFLGIFGIHVVHTFHGFHAQKGLKAKLIVWIEKALSFATSRFIAVSQGERERVIAHAVADSESTVLIFNGIRKSSPLPVRPDRSLLVLGSLTRFDPQKGNDLLVNQIARLPADLRSRVTFRLAGEGPELEAVRTQVNSLGISSIVELPGPTSEPEKFLEGIDVFVSASRGEGLSYATLETLRSGRPLLLSRVTGHTDLEGIPGVYFFALDDAREFESQIRMLLDRFPAPTALPERFTLDTMARQTLELYRSLL